MTVSELALYNGRSEERPIYLAIKGDVFDVSAKRYIYGAGGSYSFFAGRDASRAYVTGCFKEHLTHDLRGLDEEQLKVRFSLSPCRLHRYARWRHSIFVHDASTPQECC